MDLKTQIETLDAYLTINADVLEKGEYNKVLAELLKLKVYQAFMKKLDETFVYIEDMVDTADGQSPEECGLDPAHNVNELIKDLQNL